MHEVVSERAAEHNKDARAVAMRVFAWGARSVSVMVAETTTFSPRSNSSENSRRFAAAP